MTLNLLLPNDNNCSRIVKISIFKKRIIEKITYDRRVYKSVDDTSLS